MSTRPTVVMVTHGDDNESVALVAEAIRARGGVALRLDTDRFPMDVLVTVSEGDGAPEGALSTPEGSVALADIAGIWWRRIAVAKTLPRDMERQMRDACVEESRRTLFGALAASGAFTLDPMPAIRRAENKPQQLRVAREIGLDVPRTVSTNDPAAVRALAAACPGGLIAKMMASFAIYDEAGRENVVFTNPVSEADLGDLDGLSLSPMTFQERVEKALELRVTVVGEQVFAASIDSQRSARAQNDWRRDGLAMIEDWNRYHLPDDVTAKLLRYMDRFGLNYGAADFIVTPDGRHVFLEVNPAGEWFWLQRAPGLPIAEALADVLLGRAARRGGAW